MEQMHCKTHKETKGNIQNDAFNHVVGDLINLRMFPSRSET
jgi:hypothetical protein